MKKLVLSSLVFLAGYTATAPTAPIAPGVWKLGGTFETGGIGTTDDAVLVLVVQGSTMTEAVDVLPGYNYFSFNAAGTLLHTSKKWHPQFPEGSDDELEIPANYQTLALAIAAYNAAGY